MMCFRSVADGTGRVRTPVNGTWNCAIAGFRFFLLSCFIGGPVRLLQARGIFMLVPGPFGRSWLVTLRVLAGCG